MPVLIDWEYNNSSQLIAVTVDDDGDGIIELEAVRHGRWINPRLNKYGHPCHQCNQCLFVASQKDRNFCPDCGAKMNSKK